MIAQMRIKHRNIDEDKPRQHKHVIGGGGGSRTRAEH